MGAIAGFICMLCWGTADFLGAKSSKKIGWLSSLFWIQIFGLLLGTVVVFFLHASIDYKGILNNIPIIIVIGLLQAIASIAFYKGLQVGKVTLVSAITSCQTLVIILFSSFLFAEKIHIFQYLLIFFITLGVIFVSINGNETIKLKKIVAYKGIKEALVAMLFFGLSFTLMPIPSKEIGWFMPIYLARILTALILLTISYKIMPIKNVLPNKSIMIPILFVGILDFLAFLSYNFGVQYSSASLVAPIADAFPVVTILLASFFLKEKILLLQKIGIYIAIIGIFLLSAFTMLIPS